MSKRVLVTGGSRGIGLEIVRHFRESGHEVLAPGRDALDLLDCQSIESFTRENPEIDVLVNNAAINEIDSLDNVSLDSWQRALQVNLTAPFLLIQHAAKHMSVQKWGRIVNIGSVYSFVTREGRAPYTASKSGLSGLTRSAAIEYAKYNILVNQVCPGFVETDMTRQNNSPDQISAISKQIPLGRLASPSEVARYVCFLASEDNSYITGQVTMVDGGFLCQ